VGELDNSLRGKQSEVKVVLDQTSKGVQKTAVVGFTVTGVGTVSFSDLFVSIALVASIIALCTLSLKISA